jgi:gamma-glutamyltranspeptidase/glutathione hydrolase
MKSIRVVVAAVFCGIVTFTVGAASVPVRAQRGIVASQSDIASKIGADVIKDGGNAIDAAVATAFALAVTHPTAGNIGGGGFIVYRPASGEPVSYDFREKAPATASPTMWLKDGKYSEDLHHMSYLAVGVPGTVAGLHLAWKENGKLPWKRLVAPAVGLARDGFPISENLARSLKSVLPAMQKYPASVAAFSKNGVPYEGGETLKQPDLARTLERIEAQGPAGFYEGETAGLIEKEMAAHGGLITRQDLKDYRAVRRVPVKGLYRGVEVISMPPPSSGGVALIEMLNVLEGYEVKSLGFSSAAQIHVMAEAMRRAYADRAKFLGDPDFNKDMPLVRLMSKEYAADLRKTISLDHAAKSSPTTFEWPRESSETTHLSVVDANRNAVSMTYTLEYSYGSRIVVPEAGFLLNNEMGDFNAGPELTNANGSIGTKPNLAEPGKRMLSSMSPAILARDGKLFMVTGSPGGRTIINTVLETVVDAVDFGMNAQEAVDAPRFHHQWLPDAISYEKFGFSPDTLKELQKKGHTLREEDAQGVAQVIIYDPKDDVLEGGSDRRAADGAAVAVPGRAAARNTTAGAR